MGNSKAAFFLASAFLGDDVLWRPHSEGAMIISEDGDVDATDKEAINRLRWI